MGKRVNGWRDGGMDGIYQMLSNVFDALAADCRSTTFRLDITPKWYH